MEKGKRERQYWMDALRGIAVLLVVVQHSVTVPQFDGYPSFTQLGQLNDALAPYRVPLLLTLSGLFLHRSLTKGISVYTKGKLRRIAWPLLVWSSITVALSPALWGAVTEWVGPRHLWFLVTLLFCYVVGVAALRMNAGWLFLALSIAAFAVPAMTDFSFAYHFWYGAFFMFGAWISSHLHRWQAAPVWMVAPLGAVAVGGAWVSVAGIELIAPIGLLISLAGISVLLWVGGRLPRMRWLEWAGQRSIVFYVVHVPAMLVVLRLVGDADAFGPITMTCIMLIAGGAGALLLTPRWANWLFVFPPMGRHRPETAAPGLSLEETSESRIR